ncbi:MAG: EndoU domain-containing protein [Candidatus Thiodiazotropha endolucinida]|nr:EndoU domain-containing protein [Candidatus Thiodiazotropha taylori]MCW4225141.1 EndoU domain-containing protein [Candidatus Thiodiazotropha endolucinida]MCG7886712.1 EndoU domain-containing protein [Candidatus Thiodiazotropha taylori]MCG8060920.1 EndoU domain-containing protein [Candidatus Thiodiazotropha taylori]MCG8117831.1 EndoU domain-containing protein [Candidatus Thiodiazotropha taylori]
MYKQQGCSHPDFPFFHLSSLVQLNGYPFTILVYILATFSLLLFSLPAMGEITVREILKEPIVLYFSRADPYYYCEDPSDCVAHYDAKWESENLNPSRDIEIFNPQPSTNTVFGKPIWIGYSAVVSSDRGSEYIPLISYSLTATLRCPVKENGMPWMNRMITYYPDYTSECVLRLPIDQVNACPVGNPIFPEAQIKYQREEDYISQNGLLDFVRTYRSDTGSFGSLLGMRRIDVTGIEYNSHCDPIPYENPPGSGDIYYHCFKDVSHSNNKQLQLVDSTGKYTLFDASQDLDNPTPNLNVSIKPQRITDVNGNTSWQVIQDDHIERYNSQGELLDKRFADGRFVTYNYSNVDTPSSIAPRSGLKIAAQDPWGREIRFNYNADGNLSHFTDPSGEMILYRYIETNKLINEVEYPDGSVREYIWNESTLAPNPAVNALTGIEYENGARSSFGYNTSGKAISTERAGGVDKWVLSPGYNRVTVTDPLGTQRILNTTKLHGMVYLTSQSQPAGAGCAASSASLVYDTNANIASKTDFNGETTTYSYDLGRNLEIQRIEASGTSSAKTISTDWHPDWRLKVREAQPNKITTWVYNGQLDQQTGVVASCAPVNAEVIDGMPIAVICKRIVQSTMDDDGSDGFNAVTTAPEQEWSYTYNRYGKVLTMDGPRSDLADHWQYEYWPDSAVCPGASEGIGMDKGCRGELSRVINPLGHETEYLKYNAHGQLLEMRTPNNLLVRYAYDQRQRLVEHDFEGRTTGFEYDLRGLLVRVTPNDSQPIAYTYDDAGRLTQITRETTGEYLRYMLDAMGNRIAENIYDASDTLLQKTDLAYDALARLAELADSKNQTTSFLYDANGNLTQTTDAKLNPTAQTYDALDRLKQQTDALDGTTQYTYDAQDNLTSVTDPNGLTTTYDYDGLGNLISQTSPDTGTTTYTYDEAGNRLTQTNARGITVNYSYDALNRLTHISYPDTSLNVTYTYDQGTHGIGKLTSMSDVNGTTNYTYNAYGDLITQTRTSSDSVVTTFSYDYDVHGRLASLTYPSGNSVNYAYDAHGQLNTLTYEWSDGATQSLISNLQTLPFGPLKAFDYGNGLSLTRSFDLDYRLIGQTISGILQSSYQHDPVGNITDWQDLLSTGQDQLFDYDALYRLTNASGAYGDFTYTYDATGNRLSLTLDGSTETYSYVPSSHRLQQILGSVTDSRSYDAAGNTIQSLIGSYTYDDTNRMVGFTKTGSTATYAYNGKGERISKNVDGTVTRFRYGPAGQLLGEYDQTGQAIREYITLEGQPVAQIVTDPVTTLSSVYYLHTDHLGAVVKATDNTQTLVWDAERKPFGERSVTTAQIEMPLGFPGQYYDQESNNYYNYFRDYDPGTGRYLQSDPIGLAGGVNTYIYVINNPLGWIDLLGLSRNGGLINYPVLPGGGGRGGASNIGRTKPVNLPSTRRVTVDMPHVQSGHMNGGSRVSPNKTLFPQNMNPNQVERAIKDAYSQCKRVDTQGDRVKVRGTSNDGLPIEMWVNTRTRVIETAYPIPPSGGFYPLYPFP